MSIDRQFPGSISDIEELVGRELGPSSWHMLTQSDIQAFADLTGDDQWIHVDEARAASGPFGSTIGHGLLTLSLGPAMMYELMSFDRFAHSLNYGYDKVRFPSTRPVGTRVRMTATVLEVGGTPLPKSVLTRVRQTFWGDDAVKPICVADGLAYLTES